MIDLRSGGLFFYPQELRQRQRILPPANKKHAIDIGWLQHLIRPVFMRIWTLHPKYLDTRGLVTVWREALLAQKVLKGETRGYRDHPQLTRFQFQDHPVQAMGVYLSGLVEEAGLRGFHFNREKIVSSGPVNPIKATRGQLMFEWSHLKKKLMKRDRNKYRELLRVREPEPHPLFVITDGDMENWEKGEECIIQS